jgi:predicted PurR-regulated permease PerM
MEEGESLVGVTVVVVVMVVVMVVLLSHESLAEETTTTTTTLPNYQPLPHPPFFGFVFSNLSQTNPRTYANFNTTQLSRDKPKKLMQISKLHNLPQINPKLNAKFQ